MGKRSDFKRHKGDYYVTPPEAVGPLLPHLTSYVSSYRPPTFYEPCAGDYSLALWLEQNGFTCTGASDVEPKSPKVLQLDAFWLDRYKAEYFITNPPWTREILHPLINHLSRMAPTWLLFDADWMHTKQARPYLPYCHKIVSVGRVKWIKDSPHTGKDNAAWYLFQQNCNNNGPVFYGR